MRRIITILICLVAIVCGCQQEQKPKQPQCSTEEAFELCEEEGYIPPEWCLDICKSRNNELKKDIERLVKVEAALRREIKSYRTLLIDCEETYFELRRKCKEGKR